MTNEAEQENRLGKIEAQLFQIKLLLIIIADLCILGFYGLSRMGWDDIGGHMTRIWEVLIVLGLIGTMAFLIVWGGRLRSQAGSSATEVS